MLQEYSKSGWIYCPDQAAAELAIAKENGSAIGAALAIMSGEIIHADKLYRNATEPLNEDDPEPVELCACGMPALSEGLCDLCLINVEEELYG